jgi:monofunctional biosynthetic peptidoglycan transglycosylase
LVPPADTPFRPATERKGTEITVRFAIIVLLATTGAAGATADAAAEPNGSENMVLVDFAAGDDDRRWYVIDDGVMGGISRGTFTRTDAGTAVFAGELSLERNGGFSSVRTDLGTTDLSDWVGLEVRVRGDGRTYQLRLRVDGRYDGIAYRVSFQTTRNEWTTVRVPFAQFAPVFRGRIVENAPPLDTARIRQAGFLLADKQAGPFRLEIATIHAWR